MSVPAFAEPAAHVTLKDGRRGVVRPATDADAESLLACDRAIHDAGVGTMLLREELAADAAALIERMRRFGGEDGGACASVDGCQLVIEVDGAIVGEGSAERPRLARLRHNARLGFGVHPDAQGLGCGRALVAGVIRWAAWTRRVEAVGVLRLELSALGDNARALALYRSFGFKVEGRFPGKAREADGALREDVDMSLWVGGA